MTFGSWFHQIFFSDLARWLSGATKSRKMFYRGLAKSGLWQARIACPQNMTLGNWFHQIFFSDLARWLSGATKSRKMFYQSLAKFRLVVSRNWLGPGKSSSVILLFLVIHLPQFGVLGKSSSGILGPGRMRWLIFTLTYQLPERHCLSILFTFFHWRIFHLIGYAKSYKISFRGKERSRKVIW